MNEIASQTFSEVYTYLNLMGDDYINKLPKEKYSMILELRDKNYNPNYILDDFNDPKKTREETRYVILMLYLDYWCESEKLKKKIVDRLNENEKILNEQLNPFKDRKTEIEVDTKIILDEDSINKKSREEESIIEYKESFLIKIKNTILKILKNKNHIE